MPEKKIRRRNERGEMNLVAPIIDLGQITHPLLWKLGDEENVNVKIYGNPKPAIRWQIGRRRVKESSRYSMIAEELKNGRGWEHTLVVKNVHQDVEQGVWVTAENEAGQDCILIEIKTYSLHPGSQNSPVIAEDVSFNDAGSVTSLNVWKKEMEKRNHMRSVDDLVEKPEVFSNNFDSDVPRQSRRKINKSQIAKSASLSYDDPQQIFNSQLKKSDTDATAALPPIKVREPADLSPDIQSEPVRRKKRRDRLGSKISAASEVSDRSMDRQDSDLSGYFLKKKTRRKDKTKSLDTSTTSELLITDFDVEDISGSILNHIDGEKYPDTQTPEGESGHKTRKKKKIKQALSGDLNQELKDEDQFNIENQNMNGDVEFQNIEKINEISNYGIDEELFQLLGMNLSDLCASLLSGKFDPAGLEEIKENLNPNGDNIYNAHSNILNSETENDQVKGPEYITAANLIKDIRSPIIENALTNQKNIDRHKIYQGHISEANSQNLNPIESSDYNNKGNNHENISDRSDEPKYHIKEDPQKSSNYILTGDQKIIDTKNLQTKEEDEEGDDEIEEDETEGNEDENSESNEEDDFNLVYKANKIPENSNSYSQYVTKKADPTFKNAGDQNFAESGKETDVSIRKEILDVAQKDKNDKIDNLTSDSDSEKEIDKINRTLNSSQKDIRNDENSSKNGNKQNDTDINVHKKLTTSSSDSGSEKEIDETNRIPESSNRDMKNNKIFNKEDNSKNIKAQNDSVNIQKKVIAKDVLSPESDCEKKICETKIIPDISEEDVKKNQELSNDSESQSEESGESTDEEDDEDDDEVNGEDSNIEEDDDKEDNEVTEDRIIKQQNLDAKSRDLESENFEARKIVHKVADIKSDESINQIPAIPLSDFKSIILKKPNQTAISKETPKPEIIKSDIDKSYSKINDFKSSNYLNKESLTILETNPKLKDEDRTASFFAPTLIDKLTKPDKINKPYTPSYIPVKTPTKPPENAIKILSPKPKYDPKLVQVQKPSKPTTKPAPPPRNLETAKSDDKSKNCSEKKSEESSNNLKHIDSDEEDWPEPPTAEVLDSIISPSLIAKKN